MVIAFDAKRAFCNNTGLGNYSRTITNELAEQHPDTDFVLFTPAIKPCHSGHCNGMANVQTLQPSGVWKYCKGLWRSLGIGLTSVSKQIDIYHGLSQELPMRVPDGVHTVVTIHDMMPWRYPHNFPLIDRIIYKRKMRQACLKADRIVAVSQQTRDDIIEYLHIHADKIRVIYQSCEAIFRKPVDDKQRIAVRERYHLPQRYILCVGTIERRKNQASLVKAMNHVHGDVSLVIVGRKTDYYNEVQKTINASGLQRRIMVIDDARFEDFPALYAEAIISVYISLFEGFGIPILESLCCGTPVVTSNRSSMPEVGGDAALYANPEQPKDIAEKINRLLSDVPLRESLAKAGKRQSAKFTPEAVTDNIFRLYCELN